MKYYETGFFENPVDISWKYFTKQGLLGAQWCLGARDIGSTPRNFPYQRGRPTAGITSVPKLTKAFSFVPFRKKPVYKI